MFSVKTIFKTLIGTMVLICLSSLFIELFNAQIVGLQINQISKMAARQACVLFAQETYKTRGGSDSTYTGGSMNMNAIRAADGNAYISGQFYDGASVSDIYNDIYTRPAFKDWCTSTIIRDKGNWRNIRLINMALNGASASGSSGTEAVVDQQLAELYKDVYMTPLNLGVPYMDQETVDRMFRWNAAQLFSNCDPDLIQNDGSGYFINYKGYKIYAQNAHITSFEYRVFDLTDPSEKNEFTQYTHIYGDGTANLGYLDDTTGANKSMIGQDGDERQRICVVGINFTIPVAYKGITPIKRITEYYWNYNVNGYGPGAGGGTTGAYSFNEATSNMTSGGFATTTPAYGALPVPGKLIYYIVR